MLTEDEDDLRILPHSFAYLLSTTRLDVAETEREINPYVT